MKKYFLTILFLSSFFFGYSQESFVHGYFITNNNDTINANISIFDLFQLHKELVTIGSHGVRKTFKPFEIKGFAIKTKDYPDFWSAIDIDHSNDEIIKKLGYLYTKGTFNIEPEIQGDLFYGDSIWKYESIKMDSTHNAFLLVKYGYGKNFHTSVYFTKLNPNKPYNLSSAWFLIKDNKIIARNGIKISDWIESCIKDYPVLTSMVKEKKIKSFPWDLKTVIDDYNEWSCLKPNERPDTSLSLKGILDAEKYYHPIAPFAISCVGGTAFYLPGMASAVIMAHIPKESNIKIPEKLELRDNQNYSKAFKHRVYRKKFKSATNGALTGGGIFVVALIILAL